MPTPTKRCAPRSGPWWPRSKPGSRRGRRPIFHPPGSAYARALHQELAAAGVAANGPETRRLDRSVAGATPARPARAGRVGLGARRRDGVDLDGPDRGGPRPVDGSPPADGTSSRPQAGVVRGAAQWGERLRNLAARESDTGRRGGGAGGLRRAPRGRRGRAGRVVVDARGVGGRAPRPLPRSPTPSRGRPTRSPPPSRCAARCSRSASSTPSRRRTDHAAFGRAVRAVLEETGLDTLGSARRRFRRRGVRGPLRAGPRPALRRGRRSSAWPTPSSPEGSARTPCCPRRSADSTSRAACARAPRRLEELHDDVVAAVGAGATRRVATYPRVDPRTGRAQVPSRWMASLTALATRWRSVDSFAAGIAAADPPLSVRELELHDMARWAAEGHDPALSPVALRRRPAAASGIGGGPGPDGRGLHPVRRERRGGPGLPVPRRGPHVGHAARGVRQVPAAVPLRPGAAGLETHAPRGALADGAAPSAAPWSTPSSRTYLLERLAGAPRSLPRLLDRGRGAVRRRPRARGLVGKALLWRMDKAAMRRDLGALPRRGRRPRAAGGRARVRHRAPRVPTPRSP